MRTVAIIVGTVLSCSLAGASFRTPAAPDADVSLALSSSSASLAPTAAELDQLLAPIALYPDQLLAQILLCAADPAGITALNQFIKIGLIAVLFIVVFKYAAAKSNIAGLQSLAGAV